MPETPATEQPLYILSKSKKRIIIPKTLSFLVLGTIFYIGLLLNLSLLKLNASQETIIKTTGLMLLLLIVLLGIYLAIKESYQPYLFYRDHLMTAKKNIPYASITTTEVKKNFIDKFFRTYSLSLTTDFKLIAITEQIDIKIYLEQLINYTKQAETRLNSTPQP